MRVDMPYVSTWGENESRGGFTDPSYEVDLPAGVFGGDYVCRPNDLDWPDLVQQRSDAIEAAAAADQAALSPPPENLTPDQQKNGRAL